MGAEAAAQFEKNCREMYDQMARIAIVPSWFASTISVRAACRSS